MFKPICRRHAVVMSVRRLPRRRCLGNANLRDRPIAVRSDVAVIWPTPFQLSRQEDSRPGLPNVALIGHLMLQCNIDKVLMPECRPRTCCNGSSTLPNEGSEKTSFSVNSGVTRLIRLATLCPHNDLEKKTALETSTAQV